MMHLENNVGLYILGENLGAKGRGFLIVSSIAMHVPMLSIIYLSFPCCGLQKTPLAFCTLHTCHFSKRGISLSLMIGMLAVTT